MQFKHVQTTPFTFTLICHLVCRCVPRSTLTKLPNLNSSQRNCKSGHHATVCGTPSAAVLFGSSRYLLLPRPFRLRARTTGPAYQSQTQAEERGTARARLQPPTSHVRSRPPAAGRHPSTECVLSALWPVGFSQRYVGFHAVGMWLHAVYLGMSPLILQVHKPQPVDSHPL